MAKPTATARPTLLRDVPLGHEAQFENGEWVRVAATIAGQRYVRRDTDGPRQGPRPIPGHTPVVDTRAPTASADRTAVADPIAGAADRETNLFRTEDKP
jgi:hypothetical protein